jgi:hypothetical protein
VSWGVVYYADEDGVAPALRFLVKVRAKLVAVLEAVRAAPPPTFSGGGKWEAMHGAMGGYYEIRVTGPGRQHYRLFCYWTTAHRRSWQSGGSTGRRSQSSTAWSSRTRRCSR